MSVGLIFQLDGPDVPPLRSAVQVGLERNIAHASYDAFIVGLFGLLSLVGVATAPIVGWLVDKIVPWTVQVFGEWRIRSIAYPQASWSGSVR